MLALTAAVLSLAGTTQAAISLLSELQSGKNLNLAAIGTSLTDSAFEWDSNNQTVDWFTQAGNWLNSQSSSGKVSLFNYGGSGATSGATSPWSTYGSGFQQLNTALANANPDAIFIEFSTNDALVDPADGYPGYTVTQSTTNLQSMITKINTWGASHSKTVQIYVQTMNNVVDVPGSTNGSERPLLDQFTQGYRDVVAANPGVTLIDN
jgi:lysophospholipase L1-like esterase